MPHKFLVTLLVACSLCACKQRPSTPVKQYHLDGVIVSLDPQGHVANISAKPIEGWMGAMTMEYPVKDVSEFATLHVGDHITATVYVQDLNYEIGEIHHLR